MAQVRQAYPRDPLRNFRFQLHFGDPTKPIAGVQRVSGLSFSVSSYEVWEGGNNLHRYAQPDKVTWDPINFEAGLMLDNTLFEWTEQMRSFLGGKTPGAPPAPAPPPPSSDSPTLSTKMVVVPLKRTIYLTLWDPMISDVFSPKLAENTDVLQFEILNAWPSKLVAVPKLDGMGSEVAFQTLELVHEGWRLTTESIDLYPKMLASRKTASDAKTAEANSKSTLSETK